MTRYFNQAADTYILLLICDIYSVAFFDCPCVGFLYYRHLISAGKDGTFDYMSVTPPYMLVDYAVLMDQISNSSVVGENTFIVSCGWIFCWI